MKKSLKALLLAAGFGSRLRPLTLSTPKCLVKINGKPILKYWLEKLIDLGVKETLINKHYLYEEVDKYLSSLTNTGMLIETSYESKLLGTAATLIANQNFFEASSGLLIHADNYSKFNLKNLIDAHESRPEKCLITMLTFNTSNPKSCGIVETDNDGVVTSYYEKVDDPPNKIANGAIYVFDPPFMEWLIGNHSSAIDFSTEILPNLVGRIYTCHTNKPYIDIGTPEALAIAEVLSHSKN